jgi:hypothetical protein
MFLNIWIVNLNSCEKSTYTKCRWTPWILNKFKFIQEKIQNVHWILQTYNFLKVYKLIIVMYKDLHNLKLVYQIQWVELPNNILQTQMFIQLLTYILCNQYYSWWTINSKAVFKITIPKSRGCLKDILLHYILDIKPGHQLYHYHVILLSYMILTQPKSSLKCSNEHCILSSL